MNLCIVKKFITLVKNFFTMTSKEIADFFRDHYGLHSDEALGVLLGFSKDTAKQNIQSYRQRKTQGIETRMIALLIEELRNKPEGVDEGIG